MKQQDYSSLTPDQIQAKDNAVARGVVAGDLVGNDLANHLIRLANTAFSCGAVKVAEMLEHWALNPSTKDPLHRAWALSSLLRSGFWDRAEQALCTCSRTDQGREALRRLIAGSYITPDHSGFMTLNLPPETLEECRELLSGQRPWVTEEELALKLADAFRKFVNDQRARGQGGWESGHSTGLPEDVRVQVWQRVETWLGKEARTRGRLWLVVSGAAGLTLAVLALLL